MNKTIAEKVRDKEPITREEFQELFKKTDWKNFGARVVWSLNEPRCCCDSCYKSWFEWGREVYKDNLKDYEERKKEAWLHLRNKQESRRLAEQTRIETRYLCSAA